MKFFYSAHAVRQLGQLERKLQIRIAKKMRYFSEQQDPLIHAKPVEGHHGVYRFRIGDIRVLFEIENSALNVLIIAKRSEVYKDI